MTRRLPSQLLFAEVSPGLVRVDAALLEGAGTQLPAGSPVSLVLRLPVSGVVAAVVGSTLRRWAEECGAVEMELLRDGDHARVGMSDGTSTVRLEVEAAGTLGAYL